MHPGGGVEAGEVASCGWAGLDIGLLLLARMGIAPRREGGGANGDIGVGGSSP